MNKSWEPAKVLEIPKRFLDPNFVYRFASKNQTGRIDKLKAEGWEIDHEVQKKVEKELQKTISDGKAVDTSLQVRELVLMRLPKEAADARNAYYKQFTYQKGAKDELDKTGQSYGKVEITKE